MSTKSDIVNLSTSKMETLKDSFFAFDVIRDDNGVKTKIPRDLSTYTAKGQVRAKDETLISEFSTSNGRVVIGGEDSNEVSMTILTEAEIDTMQVSGCYDYDLFLFNTLSEGKKVQQGQIQVNDSVTQ